MSSIDTVVVTIVKETASLTQKGFGTALIAGYHTKFVNRVREYSSLDALITDGFAATDPVYLVAQALLSQSPRPKTFKVGRRALAPTQTEKVTPTAKASTTYTVKINGIAATFDADATATVPEIVVGLEAAIQAVVPALPVVVTANGSVGSETDLEIESSTPGAMFTLELDDSAKEGLLAREDITADPGLATDLAAIVLEDDEWYGLLLDSNGAAEIEAASAWAEARVKLFSAVTGDTDVKDGAVSDDVGSTLAAAKYERSFVTYHPKPHEYVNAAALGKLFPATPGSITLAHKQLAGVSVSKLSTGEQSALEAKKVNFYVQTHGRGDYLWGYTPSGEWIDTTHGIDDTQAQVETDVFGLLATSDKVPYTNGGAGAVAATVEAVLRRKERDGFLVKDSSVVTAPDVDDPTQVSPADKTARLLPGVEGSAQLAGAVHKTTITIKLAA